MGCSHEAVPHRGADTLNVLVLNMGRIAVDIDGIELAALIDVVCDNGYSLRVADEPGKLVVEDPLPPVTRINGIQSSTAHITRQDNTILDQTSLQRHDGSNSDWILNTCYGLNARLYPVLELKRMGLSKACRRLVVTLMRRDLLPADIIHFDASGEVLPGFTTFDW